jgi:hypothetical protein
MLEKKLCVITTISGKSFSFVGYEEESVTIGNYMEYRFRSIDDVLYRFININVESITKSSPKGCV